MTPHSPSRLIARLSLMLLGLVSFAGTQAQLLVTPNNNAAQLVQTLLGPGVTIANATLTCPSTASGTFNGTASNIGLGNGVILSSGNAIDAVGPNNSGSTSTDHSAPSDPDLNTIVAPDTSQDACVLEFDITPICDTIQISYVFGSEEYDEYVCATFNDAFGFFISGPGIVGTQNIALVPGTATPVAINTVNIGSPGIFGSGTQPGCDTTNFPYYTQNATGTSVQYDGFTVPLLATAIVTPCSTYHIKLAVADVGDGSFDSGVFLESGGIRCSSSIISLASSLSAPNAGGAVEGCVTGFFEFFRSGDTTVSQTVNYLIGGTATQGTDYTGLTGSVTFAPNQNFVSVPIVANLDGIAEGSETVFVIIFDTVCNSAFSDTATILIHDELVASAGQNVSMCEGDTANLGAAPIPTFTYVWSPVAGLTSTNTSSTQAIIQAFGTYDYVLSVSDTNGCIGDDTVTVLVNQIPTSPFTSPSVTCIGQPATISYNGNADTSATYNWNFGGGTVISGSGQGPYQVSWSTPGNYNISLDIAAGVCLSTVTTVPIEVRDRPSLAPTGVNVSCFGFGDGSVNSNVGNGTPNFTYAWSNNANTVNVSNLGPGTYTVTVTDALGCRDTASATITQPTQLSNTFTSAPILCFGGLGSITANPSGGNGLYSYLWSNGATTQTNNVTTGTYTVTITDATNGLMPCQLVASFTIPEPPQMVALIGNQIASCGQSNGTATIAVTGGLAPYQYLWSNGGTGSSIFNLAPGTYGCTVTDQNGCTVSASTVVGEVPFPSVTAGPGASFCEGEGGVQISASGFGGTPGYSYTWWCAAPPCGLDSIFDNDPIANPTGSQWYYVQVTDINGCTSNIDSLFVTVLPKPIVDAGPDAYICGDSAPCVVLTPNISGAPGPYTYAWLYSAGLNDSTILNPCARPDTTTTYTLVVSAGNGCTSDFTTTDTLSTVVVHVNPIPIAEAGPDLDICAGDSMMLQGYGHNAGPDYDFQWSPATGLSSTSVPNPIAGPPATTAYILNVWSNGCSSYGDTVRVRVHTQPTVDAGPTREICLGSSAMLDAQASGDSTATYTYLWSPAMGLDNPATEDPNASPVSTIWYHVVATSNYGCGSPSDSVLVRLLPSPVAEAGPNQAICFGNTATLNGSYSFTTTDTAPTSQVYFSWTPGSTLSDTTVLQPTANPAQAMVYYLTVRHNLCETTDSVLVSIVPDLGLVATADTNVACDGDSVLLSATAGIGGAAIQWLPSNGLSAPNSAQTWAAPGQSTTYLVIASHGGCSDSANVRLDVLARPEVSFLSSTPEGCAPLEVNFLEATSGAIFHVWNFGDGSPVSNELNPSHTYTVPGEYVVTFVGMSPGGCEARAQALTVVVSPELKVDFSSDPAYPAELSLPSGIVSFQNLTTDATSLFWDFGDGLGSSELDPQHSYGAAGTYYVTLQATNALGCTGSVTHGPYVVLSPDLFIPNVFSPNDDHVNDLFLVQYTGDQPFRLRVYDRWGLLLQDTRNKMEGWDGLDSKGAKAIEGTFYYVVDVGDKSYSGTLSLYR